MYFLYKRFSKLLPKQFLFLIIFLSLLQVNVQALTSYDEAKYLIQNYYVNAVSDEILNKPTISEMVRALNDPYSRYFTADEFQDFVNSINMKFSGIGVYIEVVDEGIKVTSVIEGSPASAVGIIKDDIITAADGHQLAGLTSDEAMSYIKGEEGTTVNLQVKRNDIYYNFDVMRREISLPTVDGQILDNHVGYIEILSFGENTASEFRQKLDSLNSYNPDCYIVDLRNNPGGYLNQVVELAGHFIGRQAAVITRDRADNEFVYYAPGGKELIDKQVIFLVNNYSASASEVLTAAVKDYGKAFIIGTRTFGKGTVQNMFALSDGSALKITVEYFFSPFGNAINKLGIFPDLNMENTDALMAARLLLNGSYGSDKTGFLKITKGTREFEIDLNTAKQPDYWNAFMNIINGLSSLDNVSIGKDNGWFPLGVNYKDKPWMLLYNGYGEVQELKQVEIDKKFSIYFSRNIDISTVNDRSIELIDDSTGERVQCDISLENGDRIIVKPKENLTKGKAYFIIINDTIRSVYGETLKQGVIGKITVAQ